MIKCSDIYTEELVFGNDNQTIIHAIGSIIDGGDYGWLNSDLSAFFTTNKETTEYEYLLNRQDKYISPLFERIYNHYKDNEDAMLTISNKLASNINKKVEKELMIHSVQKNNCLFYVLRTALRRKPSLSRLTFSLCRHSALRKSPTYVRLPLPPVGEDFAGDGNTPRRVRR